MSKEKTLRKITRILMTLALVITTVFTSVGTMGVTEVKAADGEPTLITSLDVNVDWSKVPSLTEGTVIGEYAEKLTPFPDDMITVNSSEIDSDIEGTWAIFAKQEHVDNGDVNQDDYNVGAKYYKNLCLLGWYNEDYKISNDDTYYVCVAIHAKVADGYRFCGEEEKAKDLSDIVHSNILDPVAISAYGGEYLMLYLRLGTPAEINKNNGSSSKPSTPENKGYTLEDGVLTIKNDTGMTNWINEGRDTNRDKVIKAVIENGVTSIGDNAFEAYELLTDITIPASVKKIGDYAFMGCNSLKAVNMEGAEPAELGENVFQRTFFVSKGEPGIKVPAGTVNRYKEKWSGWKDYINGSDSGNTGGSTSGTLNSNATVTEDSPVKGASLTNSKDELLAASGIFTEAEKRQIANGTDAKVWLELNKVDLNTVSEADQAAILEKAKAYMGEGTALTYFDASLFKQIAGQTTQISEPGISMKLTIKIPAELLTNDQNVTREYTIIRLHNGQAEEIKGAFDAASGEFSFETDKFSTYAIAYKDTVKSNGGNGNGNAGGNETGNNNAGGNTANTSATGTDTNTAADASADNAQTAVTSPKTGESNAMMIWAMAALISLAGAGVILYRIKRA